MSKQLPFVVEGRHCATVDDFETVPWETVATFKYEGDAKDYVKRQGEINGESAMVDQMHVRMKQT